MTVRQEKITKLFSLVQFSGLEDSDDVSAKTNEFKAVWKTTTPEERVYQNASTGETVLHHMAAHGFYELIRDVISGCEGIDGLGIAFAAKCTKAHHEYPIHWAILNGKHAVARALLDLDAENTPTYKTLHEQSPLHYAAQYGDEEMVKICWEGARAQGIGIDEMDGNGHTPLALAEQYNQEHPEVAAYLIAEHASPDAVDTRGFTQVGGSSLL